MTFYVTTPIYYANSLPHLGHLYTMIVADTIARSKRQQGIETFFLTGTDEHGINIERAAARNHRTPQEQADYVVNYFKKMTAAFGLDSLHGGYDIFMRTTEAFHYEGVGKFWRRVAKAKTPKGRDALYKGHYEGWFCAACAAYKTEDEYAKPTNPGDPPTCLIHETKLDRVSEESYFFRLSDYDQALLELYESRLDFVQPDARRNEVKSFVSGGLQDLSVSRLRSSVSWGIPVPDDPNHTMYVWFDALTNYITAIGFGNRQQNSAIGFEKFWPALHLVSKTLGNTIELDVLNEFFPTDAIRYFCLREMVFGQDGRFGYENLIDRTNSDLASGLGNLSSRTLTMNHRYCEGRVPSGNISDEGVLPAKRAGVDNDDSAIAGFVSHARDEFIRYFEELSFSRALEVAWSIVARIDKIISDAKPWDLAKDAGQRQTLNAVLYRAAETLRWLSVMLYATMPETSREIYSGLGLTNQVSNIDPKGLRWGELPPGTAIGEVKPLFPRIDKAKTIEEIGRQRSEVRDQKSEDAETRPSGSVQGDAETRPSGRVQGEAGLGTAQGSGQHTTEADAVAGVANFIDITDFAKIDLRVGEVRTAERIPKADKLLLITVDIGEEKPRQILAGIAQYYEPENLIGRKIVVVANLKPRKLRGYESQGMLLAASVGEEGKPVIATFAEDVPNGARLK